MPSSVLGTVVGCKGTDRLCPPGDESVFERTGEKLNSK